MTKENYLGVDVCSVSMGEVLIEIDNIVRNRKPSFVVAINPEKIIKAQEDEGLRNLLNSADIQIPDGVGVLLASRFKGGAIRSRVTGIELMENICKRSAEMGYKVFLLGAKPGVAEGAAAILQKKYPGFKIAGIRDGYFNDESLVIEEIKSSGSDVLFVAMGSPKQEQWITKNMDKLGVPLCMGVGGSYDVICGNIKRAPKWMCSMGLEWLYRLVKEPWRYKRMMVLPGFLINVMMDREKKSN